MTTTNRKARGDSVVVEEDYEEELEVEDFDEAGFDDEEC